MGSPYGDPTIIYGDPNHQRYDYGGPQQYDQQQMMQANPAMAPMYMTGV